MPPFRHCRHCMGGCLGGCLLPGVPADSGRCLHTPVPRLAFRQRLRLVGTRRFWHRLLWGPGPPPA